MLKLTNDELEELDGLKGMPGFKVLLKIYADKKEQTLIANSSVKNRVLKSDTIEVHETALEQMRYNNGLLDGVKYVITQIDGAYNKRKDLEKK